jgi:hypothetical protein
MHSKDHTADKELVSQDDKEASSTYSGLSHEALSCLNGLSTTTAQQTLASDPMHWARRVQQLKTQDLPSHQDTLPTFNYSCEHDSDKLHRTSLVTEEQSRIRVPYYQFMKGCCWNEVPGLSLLITGGGFHVVR